MVHSTNHAILRADAVEAVVRASNADVCACSHHQIPTGKRLRHHITPASSYHYSSTAVSPDTQGHSIKYHAASPHTWARSTD
jgi:hypothetical protein